MTPKKPGTLGVLYLVEQDPRGGRWNIIRSGKSTGSFARDKSAAVGMAHGDASWEAHETNLKTEVWSVVGGKRKREWPTDVKKSPS